jgi:outer membrane protein, multidrug efflux system
LRLRAKAAEILQPEPIRESVVVHRKGRYRSLASGIAVVILPWLAACVFTQDRLDPALEVPKTYRAAQGSPNAAPPPLDWWRTFHSAELTDLMQQGQAANFSIAVAVAQIIAADAQARIAGAALLPTISATADVQKSQISTAVVGNSVSAISQPITTTYSTALNASYTLDFWGHNAALLRAAEFTAVGTRFAREFVTLTQLASIANTYFAILEAQDRLELARKNTQSTEDILKLIQDRFTQGTAAALDVAQQASLVAIQRATIPPFVQAVQQNIAALALLVGRAPAGLTVKGGSMYRLAIPRVTPGLPSQLLERRPDIREAEANLASADANVDAARTAFFPTISLTGEAGFESAVLKTLFGPGAAMYTLAAGVTQPIFEGGTLLGQLDLQKGTREELLQDYRMAVISAFTGVEQALVAVQQTTLQEQLQRASVAESRRAYDLSLDKLHQGTIDATTLLTVEETLFTQEDVLAQVRFARLEAIVSLFQALGGGWLEERKHRDAELTH